MPDVFRKLKWVVWGGGQLNLGEAEGRETLSLWGGRDGGKKINNPGVGLVGVSRKETLEWTWF